MKLEYPNFRYVDYKRYRSAYVWNNIPIAIREKPTYESFKSALKRSETETIDEVNFAISSRALRQQDFTYY